MSLPRTAVVFGRKATLRSGVRRRLAQRLAKRARACVCVCVCVCVRVCVCVCGSCVWRAWRAGGGLSVWVFACGLHTRSLAMARCCVGNDWCWLCADRALAACWPCAGRALMTGMVVEELAGGSMRVITSMFQQADGIYRANGQQHHGTVRVAFGPPPHGRLPSAFFCTRGTFFVPPPHAPHAPPPPLHE